MSNNRYSDSETSDDESEADSYQSILNWLIKLPLPDSLMEELSQYISLAEEDGENVVVVEDEEKCQELISDYIDDQMPNHPMGQAFLNMEVDDREGLCDEALSVLFDPNANDESSKDDDDED